MIFQRNVGSIIRMVICFVFISSFIVGCSTAKSLLSQLKFWDPGSETKQAVLTQEQGRALPPTRPVLRGNPDSHYLLGQYLQQSGRHREAIEEYRKTVKIDPMYAKAYNSMGISYDNLGEFAMATKCYEVALELSPTGEYFNNLGYNLILKEDYDEAIEVLKTAVALDPRNEQIRNNLALAYSNTGSHDDALEEIQQTDNPNGNRLALAQALLTTGKTLIASDLVRQASTIDPILEQKLSEKDQFVIKIARSLKQQESTHFAAKEPEKPEPGNNGVQQSDRKAKETGKTLTPTINAKTRLVSSAKDRVPVYPSDFMFNKKPRVINMVSESQKPRIDKESEAKAPLIHQFFPVQYVAGSNLMDRTVHTSWF